MAPDPLSGKGSWSEMACHVEFAQFGDKEEKSGHSEVDSLQ